MIRETHLERDDRDECDACGAYLTMDEPIWTNHDDDFVACSPACAERLERKREGTA